MLILLLSQIAFAQPQTLAGKPVFTFRSGFWVNLHHFLYVLGRAKNGTPDSQRPAVIKAPADIAGMDSLKAEERKAWDDAIAYYQGTLSKKDAVFDRDLIAITSALAAAGDSPSLADANVSAAVRDTLERAAPVYRKVWWDRHSRADRARIEELQMLLARYGRPISDRLTHIYQQKWPPEGLTVQVAAYVTWAGAYSTESGVIVTSSMDEATSGSEGLETVFHEAMHQWDDAMIPLLNETALRVHAKIPRDLFHSLIFYTAGYVVAQVVPGHRPYAEPLWARGVLPGRQQLDTYWLPYLRGEGTLQSAVDKLVAAFQ
jgi:hypothetical protein